MTGPNFTTVSNGLFIIVLMCDIPASCLETATNFSGYITFIFRYLFRHGLATLRFSLSVDHYVCKSLICSCIQFFMNCQYAVHGEDKVCQNSILTNEPAHEIMYLSHRRPAKAQASLRIRAVSPEPSLFAHMEYGSRRRVRSKIKHLAPLHGCACAFEE